MKIAVNEGRFSYSSGLDYGILDGITQVEYYSNRGCRGTIINTGFCKLGMKLGFTISENVFGYGLVIPHYVGQLLLEAGIE